MGEERIDQPKKEARANEFDDALGGKHLLVLWTCFISKSFYQG